MDADIKDFQEATAQHVFQAFTADGQSRMLVADEVGLGKTYVARRVIELMRQWRIEHEGEEFKVVYICSNANIAQQNIDKLGVKRALNFNNSRLTMQHLDIALAQVNNSNDRWTESIIPLTPSTSFNLKSSRGTAYERALMFCFLRQLPQLETHDSELSDFLSFAVDKWEDKVQFYENLLEKAGGKYRRTMLRQLRKRLSRRFLNHLLEIIQQEDAEWTQLKDVLRELRTVFAYISVDMLNPDLVIMDEFQRFSDLLVPEDDTPQDANDLQFLAQKFFNSPGENTKILLLSATPYKPFTTLEELNTRPVDESYSDFLHVTDFLFHDPEKNEAFHSTWKRYCQALRENVDFSELLTAKDEAQEMLFRVMCRTERLNTGAVKDYSGSQVKVQKGDILGYAQGQRLMEILADNGCDNIGNIPAEYVKSSPYLLSFMDRYILKENIEKGLERCNITLPRKNDSLLLRKTRINLYAPISANHGKLQLLHDIVFGNPEQSVVPLLLWVPASHPYYRPSAASIFQKPEAQQFSKILLFSCWEMVPRMVSAMMSYYAEYYTFGQLNREHHADIKYFSNGKNRKRYGQQRLRDDNPLEYPCRFLAELYNPQEYFGKDLEEIQQALVSKLEEIPELARLRQTTRGSADNITALMRFLDGEEIDSEVTRPRNACRILADMAIASPAICALRISHDTDDARKVAQSITTIFNRPESAAVIDLVYKNPRGDDASETYYLNVLHYCMEGNLQAVLDEYAHMLQSPDGTLANAVSQAVIDTASLKVDTRGTQGTDMQKVAMRTHFAVPFINKAQNDETVQRFTNVRNAFNSPFRPFIVASTSIGQEGLDFHWYARKIVHWNLPSNPVDIEQREGRINRYKCLAVRRSVARRYGDSFSWDEMFERAARELKGRNSDLVPYWCLPDEEVDSEASDSSQLQPIERIVPMYPWSRDTLRYRRLRDILALYRLTLGQPRQEELLDMLERRHYTPEQQRRLLIDLSPYSHDHPQ